LRTTPVPSPRGSRDTQVRHALGYNAGSLPSTALQQAGDDFEATPPASNTRQDKAGQEQARVKSDQQAKSTSKAKEGPTTSDLTQASQSDVSSVQFNLPSKQTSKASSDRPKVTVPQSILKRPRQASPVEESQRVRSNRETAEGKPRSATSTSEESTTSDVSPSSQTPRQQKATRQGQESKSGSRRKKASFVPAGKDRRRPSFVHRKSSQSSAVVTQGRRTSPTAASTSASTSDAPSWVVDRDFRSKFVDQKKRQDHFEDLVHQPLAKTRSTVASTSTAAAGTLALGELLETTDLKGKGKARVSVVDEEVPLKPAAPSASTTSAIDDGDSPVSGLPRTKSQLTLLLERDRRRSEDISAGTAELPKPRKTSG
jgi:hypothetical protein